MFAFPDTPVCTFILHLGICMNFLMIVVSLVWWIFLWGAGLSAYTIIFCISYYLYVFFCNIYLFCVLLHW